MDKFHRDIENVIKQLRGSDSRSAQYIISELETMDAVRDRSVFRPTYGRMIDDTWDFDSRLAKDLSKIAREYIENY